ncbi:Wzz/FepE/Etk N-terminal domain-containing protein [Janthinobacterium sp. SUN137]|uniref:GumC family protein n=1 Tax=Janthinobacterium sp. SUN137 TaxID=3014789 RepID=UPI002712ACF2|nr:Wzz/FepE/Etk N-terminal domain-containing protein [Janthinobacterium sp. SUN137]MDO8038862.1 Wzz/FepE/Etk N-terminal domain-containing protein [Janthinobacterium sp. SUN137]
MIEELKDKVDKVSPAEMNDKDDEVSLLDILTALARQKKTMLIVPLVTGILAIAIAFLMVPKFSATAVILPPQQQQSSGVAAMLGQLGGLAGAAGSIAGLKNPNDLYVGMLESRTIADKLISRFDLKKRYDVETLDEARNKLKLFSTVSSEKNGTISILVEDIEAKFAAELANSFVTELSYLTKGLAISDAAQRRLFFEKQLLAVKNDLADAEIALRKTQESTGLLQPDGQVQGIIRNVAQLEGTIAAKEVQLNSMRSFATSNNPDLMRLQSEIQGYRAQLEKLKVGKLSGDGDLMVPTGKLPEVGIEYIRRLRNVKYQETIFELLSKQYELAKIDEAKESSIIQILDVAVPAEKKAKPKRSIIILLGFVGGVFLGMLIALMRDAYVHSMKDEKNRYRWSELRMAWKNKNN